MHKTYVLESSQAERFYYLDNNVFQIDRRQSCLNDRTWFQKCFVSKFEPAKSGIV